MGYAEIPKGTRIVIMFYDYWMVPVGWHFIPILTCYMKPNYIFYQHQQCVFLESHEKGCIFKLFYWKFVYYVGHNIQTWVSVGHVTMWSSSFVYGWFLVSMECDMRAQK